MIKRKTWKIGLIILSIILIFFAFKILSVFITLPNDRVGCGNDVGPVYGEKVIVQLDSLKIDNYLIIPDGELGISNTTNFISSIDTIPPILVKFDKKHNLVWAVKLNSKKSGIPLYDVDNIKLVADENGKRITFFNLSHSEPGTIYLTDKFEFDYLCLKAF
jgi:hypothetical protein